jgi:hypothetical protein
MMESRLAPDVFGNVCYCAMLVAEYYLACSNDNLRDKKVIRDINMSKLNNEDVIEVACVFGEEIRCSDCHWI